MAHLDTPGVDAGTFSTEEVRPRTKPSKSTSRKIVFFPGQYKKPPSLATGFRSLELAHETPARASLVASDVTEESFKVALETWGNSTLYSASATWLEHKLSSRDCQSGQFDTHETAKGVVSFKTSKKRAQNENKKTIHFRREYKEDCEVVCWLNRIDTVSYTHLTLPTKRIV